MLLTIELVPKNSWFSNLRSELQKADWDRLRRMTYRKAGYVCEICGGKGDKWPVECHEIWRYDDTNKVQKLTGLIALCPACHQVKHIGLATVSGNIKQAHNHLATVNDLSNKQAQIYISDSFDVWRERSKYDWQIDLSWLETVGITPPNKSRGM